MLQNASTCATCVLHALLYAVVVHTVYLVQGPCSPVAKRLSCPARTDAPQATSNGQVQLLLSSSLSLNVVSGGGGSAIAWLLDSRVGGGPVAGAEVSVYGVQQQYYTGYMVGCSTVYSNRGDSCMLMLVRCVG